MDDVYARYREALGLGHQQAAEGKFAQALGHYRAAAELAGDRALPHIAIGSMHLRLGHPKEALAAYDRALQAEAGNIDALNGRTSALLAAGRRDEAAQVQKQIAELREGAAIDSQGTADGTPMSRAETLHVAGERALRTGKQDAAIDAWLAESAEHAATGHLDAALDAALGALSVSASAPRIHLELARLYFMRGWNERGTERLLLLDRLLSLSPDTAIQGDLQRIAAENASVDDRLVPLARRAG